MFTVGAKCVVLFSLIIVNAELGNAQSNEMGSSINKQRNRRQSFPSGIDPSSIEIIKCSYESKPFGPDVTIITCGNEPGPALQPIVSPSRPRGSQNVCHSRHGRDGQCIRDIECPHNRLLRRRGSPIVCDRRRYETFVCCETERFEDVTPEEQRRNSCRLPNGEDGDCVQIVNCPGAREFRQGPRSYPCGPPGTVCCRRNRQDVAPRPWDNNFPDGNPPTTPLVKYPIPTSESWQDTTSPLPITQRTASPEVTSVTQLEVPATPAPGVKQNDPCQLSNGGNGECLFVFQCPSALTSIQQGVAPQICGKQGSETLVCCKTNNTVVPEQRSLLDTSSVSYQKCVEYYSEVERFTESKIYNKPFVVGGAPAAEKEFPHMSENSQRNSSALYLRKFVIGGVASLEKEFPHMAALGYGTPRDVHWLCGGSLISPNFILTAAHCTYSQEQGEVRFARMGLLNLNFTNNNLQDFLVTQIIRHPDYNSPIQYNDIALLKLNKDADFTDYVKPACLYNSHELPLFPPIATGWGKTQFNGHSSEKLQKVTLSYFSIEKCRQAFATVTKARLPNGILDESQVCAGGVNEEKDTCQGDSGGPLQIKLELGTDKPSYIIGITSFGKACGIPNTPAVYTRVSHYVPWIERIVWPQN